MLLALYDPHEHPNRQQRQGAPQPYPDPNETKHGEPDPRESGKQAPDPSNPERTTP